MSLLDNVDNIIPTEKCPRCKEGTLVTHPGVDARSTFIGCSTFPKCRFIYNLKYGLRVKWGTKKKKPRL